MYRIFRILTQFTDRAPTWDNRAEILKMEFRDRDFISNAKWQIRIYPGVGAQV